MNKETYDQKIKYINDLIKIEEEIIKNSQNVIRTLKNNLDNHIRSCNHKHDNGTTALKETRYWHSEPYEHLNDWTGEMEEHDNGYTVYGKECLICGEEYES